MRSDLEERLWIGLVHFTAAKERVFADGILGAYTNALAMATSKKQFIEAVTVALSGEGYSADRFDDVEPYDVRISASQPAPELYELAERAELDGTVEFGAFHAYSSID